MSVLGIESGRHCLRAAWSREQIYLCKLTRSELGAHILHYFGTSLGCLLSANFGQTKPIVHLFYFMLFIYLFISLSLKTTQEGQSKSTFCLFAICNARLGGRRCSASSVKDRNTPQPSAAPRGEPSALAFKGCIVDAVALCGMGHAFQTQI